MARNRLRTEDQTLRWLRRQPATAGLLGDDAAFLEEGGPWAVTVDRQAAGVHVPADLDPAVFAARLLAVNLSDLAACGAEPAYAFLVLAAPADYDRRRFFRALLRQCGRYGVVLAGGDLSRAEEPEATLTLLGRRLEGGTFLRRSAARAGDRLWLGGTLGESAAGRELVARGARPHGSRILLPSDLDPDLGKAARRAVRRHLFPRPQLELGHWLARSKLRCATIDVSDGLALDCHRLAQESGTGCILEEEKLPSSPGFGRLAAAVELDARSALLGGGEDYVLLFSLPDESEPPPELGCVAIGGCTRETGILLREHSGSRPLPPLGWDHFES